MIRPEGAANALNFVLFQAAWFICVLYPGLPAVVLALMFVMVHLIAISRNRWAEVQFIGLGTVLGGMLDSLWFRLGILDDGTGALQLTPPWLVAIWATFMTTFSHSLSWVTRKRLTLLLLPPVAGPLAYWSAAELGAIELPEPAWSIAALATGWLVLFPLLTYLRKLLYPELVR
ncbi:DUF2878 domain-containing protein [Marinobacter salinexigens]|uniref:DUF2878 domain-containing protein n=1 Tax=Marinobacter salinexigens TaxID=2919747 RepID=A0A5B0VKI1_9GAMM|nr:DUF2878 domain-containing protein [Marinobacter salinexigens]KAA1175172.1 DUF2878 domain-containing protein [Marinobacter salinexigens]